MKTYHHPCITMVANDDRLVSVGPVDVTNDVVDWTNLLSRDDVQRQLDARCRARAVLCVKSTNPPGTIDLLSRLAMTVQGLQQGFCGSIRDWNGRNLGDDV